MRPCRADRRVRRTNISVSLSDEREETELGTSGLSFKSSQSDRILPQAESGSQAFAMQFGHSDNNLVFISLIILI